jgi:hypothetical protein
VVLAAVLVAVSLGGAQQPPRDLARRQPPEPVGTGIIRGRVVAADTGSPIRHAQVNLSPVPPVSQTGPASSAPLVSQQTLVSSNGTQITAVSRLTLGRPKTATTDAQGVFEFRDLPAGSYRVVASPAQYAAGYLTMAYGATRPIGPGSADPGTPIELADGQVFDKATVALLRGAVITGRVTDDNGEVLTRVQVYTILYPPGSARGMRTGSNVQTDDLGQFRLFGLPPGDYVVAAEARGNMFVPPNAPPETENDRIGFLTTYYPASGDEAAAQRIRAKAGAETPSVEIRMVSGRLFHLTGFIVDSQGRPSPRANGTLFKQSTTGGAPTSGFGTDDQGRFQMRNIAPGNYRLTVRQQVPPQRNPDGTMSEQGEFASLPLTISDDLDDILVTTSPGVTIAGTVVFENGPPARGQTGLQMRVSATPGDPGTMTGLPLPQPALVGQDLTFTMKGMAGELLLRTAARQNALESVQLAGGEDITDVPHEFKAGERVTITLTDQASRLDGTVTDAVNKPVSDAAIILFSDDKAAWRSNSIRTHRGATDSNGHYALTGVLPGRYFVVAFPRERMYGLTLADPSVFDALSKEATTVAVGQNEQRQVDLRISAGGGI